MNHINCILLAFISLGFALPARAGEGIDQKLTKQVADIYVECQKIAPGVTRRELLKVFTTEGGLSTATQRTFIHRQCPIIKVDVEFKLSDPKQGELDERPTDTISKISRPYLAPSIRD
ncbi:hypothetical protein [Prosthecobacter sp.]|uniref:hypothetical protein n=1 Tax=Prosthecobacter sp. TaxID=1965333 RepID=UPI003784F9E7